MSRGPGVNLIFVWLCVFATGRFMLNLASIFGLVFIQSRLALWSPRLKKRELVYVHLVLLFVYLPCVKFCPFSLLLHARGWLRLVLVARPGRFY